MGFRHLPATAPAPLQQFRWGGRAMLRVWGRHSLRGQEKPHSTTIRTSPGTPYPFLYILPDFCVFWVLSELTDCHTWACAALAVRKGRASPCSRHRSQGLPRTSGFPTDSWHTPEHVPKPSVNIFMQIWNSLTLPGTAAAGNGRQGEHRQPKSNFCRKMQSLLQWQSPKLKCTGCSHLFHWALNSLTPGSVSLITWVVGSRVRKQQ